MERDKLFNRLGKCTNLPSPPGVAARIIELCEDPGVDLNAVANVLGQDPALTSKVLRIANSPLYRRQRRFDNLRQAMTVFGLNGTLTLALSFSLVTSLRKLARSGMDYGLYWRRSLAAATIARGLGRKFNLGPTEDLFLAALLQDVGMLALDKAVPELYPQIVADHTDHSALAALEARELGADHAAVGAWLLQSWGLPERLTQAVAKSHEPVWDRVATRQDNLIGCTAASGRLADIWMQPEDHDAAYATLQLTSRLFAVEPQALGDVLSSAIAELNEAAGIYEVEVGDEFLAETILERAKEMLIVRNLQAAQRATELNITAESLESRTRELEEKTRRDGLTGLYNRAHFDQSIRSEFAAAKEHRWPLSVAFIDLDRFKWVNDTHGHQAGDQILQAAARLLTASTRNSDIVARYGGEEFITVLPGTNRAGARVAGHRILQAFRDQQHCIADQVGLVVTCSIGIATLAEAADFSSPEELVRSADRAMYAAKLQGRNRLVVYDEELLHSSG